MADIHAATSTYESGTNDTATPVTANVSNVLAVHRNAPSSAITQMQTIMGLGTTLKGSAADLATRLSILLDADGKMKTLSSANKTTFPGTVSEGMLGTASLTASEVVRMHATLDKLESAGVTIPVGASGDVAIVTDTQTLTNKTLTTPTLTIPVIADFTSATHTHLSAATGGNLGTDSVGTAQIKTVSNGTFTTSAYDGAVGTSQTFTTAGAERYSEFTIDSVGADGVGNITVSPYYIANATAAVKGQYVLVDDGTGTGGGGQQVTVTWDNHTAV